MPEQTPTPTAPVAVLSDDGSTVTMTDPAAVGPEPPVVPGKESDDPYAGFSSVEELAAAYRKMKEEGGGNGNEPGSGAPATPPSPEDPDGAPPTPVPETREEAETVLKNAALDIGEFEAEYARDGRLGEESYKKLADAGFSREVVDRYIQASRIISDNAVADVKKLAGGEEDYARMADWARQHLSPEEQAVYNDIMNSGSLPHIRMAVAGLVGRWRAENGRPPALSLTGSASASGGSGIRPFASSAEVVEAMRDPRYGKDPAYVKAVERRLAVSAF